MTHLAPLFLTLALCLIIALALPATEAADKPGQHLKIRGIYGGVPETVAGKTLRQAGVNAIFIGEGGINAAMLAKLHGQGIKVFAEFATVHNAGYVKAHPDSAPFDATGKPAPAPDGWQGVCPTHDGFRKARMDRARELLKEHAVDGLWLDYHHAHSNWERAEPILPDTCFCNRCLTRFQRDTGVKLPDEPTPALAKLLLGDLNEKWVQWRCEVLTDWMREFREIIDQTRPTALLGTYHCPWSDTDYDGALKKKLHIDLKAQAAYVDVFSTMPYHARFNHADDPDWVRRQVKWLGEYLGIKGQAGEKNQIWPIVQASDWGEAVTPKGVRQALQAGSELPATGVMLFRWGTLKDEKAKQQAIADFYNSLAPLE